MTDTWKRLENLYSKYSPDILADLMPGASKEEFDGLEKLLKIQLPQSFWLVYLIHNGQTGIAAPALVDWYLLPIKSIQKQWLLMSKLLDQGALNAEATAKGPVQPVWWKTSWIPVGASGGGDFQCLDLDPAPGGKAGQIVTFLHTDGERCVAASSLLSWMDDCAKKFEQEGRKTADRKSISGRKQKK